MKKVGRNQKAPFCAFGDDSAYKDVLAYAYAVFHRKNIAKAKNDLKMRCQNVKLFFCASPKVARKLRRREIEEIQKVILQWILWGNILTFNTKR